MRYILIGFCQLSVLIKVYVFYPAMDLDEFQNKVRQQQKLEYDQRLEKRSQVNAASNTRRAEAKINCQQCGRYETRIHNEKRAYEWVSSFQNRG